MGNGIGKLSICFIGGSRRRRHQFAGVYSSDPLDEGFGHSFCYIRPDPTPKTNFPDEPTSQTPVSAVFRTISGASISANASTPLSTALVDIGPYSNAGLDKASAFESSNLFSSIPLQPIPRSSVSSVLSGPIPRVSGPGSGPIERGFMSGPIERSFTSGPLENQYDQLQRYKPKAKRWAYVSSLKKALSKSLWGSGEFSWPEKPEKHYHIKHNNNINNNPNNYYGVVLSGTNSNTTSNSNTLSSQASLFDDDYDENNDSFRSQNVQWAQGKAGEDRVHIVISEEHGWVFVGIYDGFNGPDATDFLLNNLYSNVYKELKGLLWTDKSESVTDESILGSSCDMHSSKEELGWKLRAKVNKSGSDGVDNHSDVLKALSEGLRKTEESYLEIADMMMMENPELALMGSCVLVMLMKGEDVYLMNVGDSRAVLARKIESDRWNGKIQEELEQSDLDLFDGDEFSTLHNLSSSQLTMDHCTSIKEEVQRIKCEHANDPFAVTNDRVKGSLKVTRAFGAGFLKQPKWNNALLEVFRIDYVGNSPYITCSPHMYHHRLGPRDKFLILSSDGLYQYFTNEEAVSEVEFFMSTFPEGDPAQHLVEEVLFRAAKKAGMDFHELLDIPQGHRRKYHDDVSIIIISFEGRIWRSSV